MRRQITLAALGACLAACQSPQTSPGPVAWRGDVMQQSPVAERPLELTIYQGDLGLVREARTVRVEAGQALLRWEDVAPRIDVGSVLLRAERGEPLPSSELRYVPAAASATLLEAYTGKEVQIREPEKDGPLVTATLVSVGDRYVFRLGDRLVVRQPGEVVLPDPPADTAARPALEWKLADAAAGERSVALSYLTGGLDWRAEYALLLRSDTLARLEARVSLTNESGKGYANAGVTLLAGDIQRTYPVPAPLAGGAYARAEDAITSTPVGDYHAYALPGRRSLPNHQVTQASLFDAPDVPVTRRYLFESFGHESAERRAVRAELRFDNTAAAGLGRPLPAGRVRVYQADAGLTLLGEDQLGHTPADERIKIRVGGAFDLVGERKQVEVQRVSEGVREERYAVVLRNHRESAVTVDVVEHPSGDWSVVAASEAHRRESANELVFPVAVPAKGETTLTFTLRFEEPTAAQQPPRPLPVEPSTTPVPVKPEPAVELAPPSAAPESTPLPTRRSGL